MNPRILAILAALTLVVGALAYFSSRSRTTTVTEQSGQASPDMGKLLPDLGAKASSASSLTLTQGTSTLELRKVEGSWVVPAKSNFPARLQSVSDLVSGLANARVLEQKTSRPELYAKIGVEDPAQPGAKSTLVKLADTGGAPLASVIVGNAASAPGSARRFVRLEGQPQSVMVSGNIETSPQFLSWVDSEVVQIPSSRMSMASFTVPSSTEKVTTTLRRTDAENNTYVIDNLPENRKVKDEYAPSRAAQCLAFVNFEDVRPLGDIPWDGPEVSSAEFRTTDGLVLRTKTATVDGKSWTRFIASFEPPSTTLPNPPVPADTAPAPSDSATPAHPSDPAAQPSAPAANQSASIEPESPAATPAAAPPATPTHVTIPVDESRAKEIQEEVATLNAKFEKWAYALPEFTVSRLRTTLSDLLAPLDAPAIPGPAAPGAGPGGLTPPGGQ
jgi:hypothetical protein